MTSFAKRNGRRNYSKGVAAGFEEESSEDDFMFGDDSEDRERSPKALFNVQTESSSNKHWEYNSAPWLTNKESNPVTAVENNHVARVPQRAISTDASVLAEDFRVAVMKGDKNYVEEALSSGFAIDTKLRSGWTALMYAASSGQLDIIQFLIESGANANFQKDMFTALMALCSSTAIDENHLVECGKYLLTSKARINTHDRHLMTSLMYAAQNGRPDLVKLLVDNQADVNAQDTRGWSALAFAASSGHTHVVKVLLNSKVNDKLCGYDGQSPADLAYANGFTALASILENASCDNVSRLEEMSSSSRSSKGNTSTRNSRYIAYGDLELFLCGLELGEFVNTFQEHHLSFEDFLKISDKELVEIGISELGVRKRILEATRGVHTNEWDLSGLSVDKTSKISTLEAAAIIANITKHLMCIQSSVLYLQDYINDNKEFIEKDDASLQNILVEQCKDGVKVTNKLEENMNALQSFVTQAFPKAHEKPCDMIDIDKLQKKVSRGKKLLRCVSVIAVLGLASALGYKAFEYHTSR